MMKSMIILFALIILCAAPGCSDGVGGREIEMSVSPQARLNDRRIDTARNLQDRIEKIAATAGGRVGVAATVLESGESVSLNADGRFPMQSVYKLPIGMAVLNHIDNGKLSLAQRVRVEPSDFVRAGQHSPVRDRNPKGAEVSIRELLRLAVAESDGTASDVLLRLVGGPRAVAQYLNELRVDEIIVADSEKEIGRDWETQYRNWATPRGAVALLRALHDRRGLTEQSRNLLLRFMVDSPTGPKRLKGLLPAGTTVAHKTGTSGTAGGITAATNDIGLVTLPDKRQLAVAIFVADARADVSTREAVIAKITRALYDEYVR